MKLNEIKRVLCKLNNPSYQLSQQLSRQARLQFLVDKYGSEAVALAAGYSLSTLHQYLRVKRPSSIGEDSVSTAESIFKELDET